METKICTKCNSEYPKTTDYFFKKVIKQKLASGKLAVYNSFRSVCKKCHGKQGNNRRIKKRCKELNCKIEDYRENWKNQYTNTRTVDLEARSNLTESEYSNYIKFVRSVKVSSCSEYLIYVEKSKVERNERLRNEVLSKQKYFTNEDKRLALRMYANNEKERLTDAYIANHLFKSKIEDLEPEIIETKRNIIKLKRELKKHNIKIN